jgi:hypothetical protein
MSKNNKQILNEEERSTYYWTQILKKSHIMNTKSEA